MSGKIRVMIVDDSIFFREFLSKSLSTRPDIEVVGVSSDAYEAMEKIPLYRPDVIALDMEMPKMRGTEFLKQVRPRYPNIQVIVISALSNNVFDALAAGAVDFVSKPNTRPNFGNEAFLNEAIHKIKIAVASTISRTRQAASAPPPAARAAASASVRQLAQLPIINAKFPNPRSVVAIGASTGGTEAILAVVRELPANFPGIVIVQHMPPGFTKMYADRLDKICKMKVREAQNGDRIETGTITIAAGDKHMRLKSDLGGYYVYCSTGEKVSGHCPSIDVLFESVAETAGANAVGVILTGMGADGAKKLLEMKKRGAYTFGQDQATSIVYGMPMVAFNIGGVKEQLPLEAIPNALIRQLSRS
ncbi:MAG: chemotaxis response regulator protein-glutamate methylesterase [Oscillospiraceae bacterium]|nr:chemotaxis response regulator protein-glutamate methylesterase [Oscillospiraceae bacterium]